MGGSFSKEGQWLLDLFFFLVYKGKDIRPSLSVFTDICFKQKQQFSENPVECKVKENIFAQREYFE